VKVIAEMIIQTLRISAWLLPTPAAFESIA